MLFRNLNGFQILIIGVIFLNGYGNCVENGKLLIPNTFIALSGDLHLQWQIQNTKLLINTETNLKIKLSKGNNNYELIDGFRLNPDPRINVTQFKIQCNKLYRGGNYEIEITTRRKLNGTVGEQSDTAVEAGSTQESLISEIKENLEVKWPQPIINVRPNIIGTYPDEPVIVNITFPDINCIERNSVNLSEFWLELIHCNQATTIECMNFNKTKNNSFLYAEQIRGFVKSKIITLKCDLFGLAGLYLIRLRPVSPTPSFVSAVYFLKADWNEKFVFNVRTRSILPCDPHSGINVLFEYPKCILDQSDRIRLFGKLTADVASLKPPTTLHYITEQRVNKGMHSMNFECDFFSEKYIEYCFIYVTQSLSGAVADIRTDCVPTLPVTESDIGGWGAWSEWTPCSATCMSGTRNRYRFCDSPPPRYGAKFCEGPAVETENCQLNTTSIWDCLDGVSLIGKNTANDISSEIGPGCRCGCIVHLGNSKPKRLIAASAQSCPGRSFWLIQADDKKNINFLLDFIRLPCSLQFIKIRDGDSLSSNLIFHYNNDNENLKKVIKRKYIISSGSQLLIEFYTDEFEMNGQCKGGFLATIEQIIKRNNSIVQKIHILKNSYYNNTYIHILFMIFAAIIIVISSLLGLQYIFRYRKYHLTLNKNDLESPFQTPRNSIGSLQQHRDHHPLGALSTSTLLSEVIYLVKIRPKGKVKHAVLRESIYTENVATTESNFSDNLDKCAKSISNESIRTLTNESEDKSSNNSAKTIPATFSKNTKTTCSLNSIAKSENNFKELHMKHKEKFLNDIKKNLVSTDILKRKIILDNNPEKETVSLNSLNREKHYLSISNSTLTNGYYSPATSIVSTATIRTTTNPKESKEKKNREKLLSRPDSEFSIQSNPEELELDYYDYNINHAGAAPGSYLGMDPQYLVWIPPLDDNDILNEDEPLYEEIVMINNNDNQLDKENDSDKAKSNLLNQNNLDISLADNTNLNSNIYKPLGKLLNYASINQASLESLKENHQEKETSVIKSPSDLQNYYEMEDIKFADE